MSRGVWPSPPHLECGNRWFESSLTDHNKDRPVTDRKRKYGEPTEMVAIRMPVSLHQALRQKAKADKRPKSDTLVDLLQTAIAKTPAKPAKDIFK